VHLRALGDEPDDARNGGTATIRDDDRYVRWTATSNSSFISVTSGGSGTNNGTVTINVAAGTGARAPAH
jgi:hypothetical protein